MLEKCLLDTNCCTTSHVCFKSDECSVVVALLVQTACSWISTEDF